MRKLNFMKITQARAAAGKGGDSEDIHFIRLCSLGVAAIFMITVIIAILLINLG
jgi:hypothetical protein